MSSVMALKYAERPIANRIWKSLEEFCTLGGSDSNSFFYLIWRVLRGGHVVREHICRPPVVCLVEGKEANKQVFITDLILLNEEPAGIEPDGYSPFFLH